MNKATITTTSNNEDTIISTSDMESIHNTFNHHTIITTSDAELVLNAFNHHRAWRSFLILNRLGRTPDCPIVPFNCEGSEVTYLLGDIVKLLQSYVLPGSTTDVINESFSRYRNAKSDLHNLNRNSFFCLSAIKTDGAALMPEEVDLLASSENSMWTCEEYMLGCLAGILHFHFEEEALFQDVLALAKIIESNGVGEDEKLSPYFVTSLSSYDGMVLDAQKNTVKNREELLPMTETHAGGRA